MEKKSKNDDVEQGSDKIKVMTETDFGKMVDTDLKTCVSFLHAIHQDAATKKALTEFLYGRYLNQIHRAELEQQVKIEA